VAHALIVLEQRGWENSRFVFGLPAALRRASWAAVRGLLGINGCGGPGVYLLQSVTSAATLAIYVLLPRTSVTQTTSRVFHVLSRTQTASTAGRCAPPTLSSPFRRAAPCGSPSNVFQEKKASSDVSVPSGLCSKPPLCLGMATFTPAAWASIPVAFSEGALVAAVNQANSTSAVDTLVSF